MSNNEFRNVFVCEVRAQFFVFYSIIEWKKLVGSEVNLGGSITTFIP